MLNKRNTSNQPRKKTHYNLYFFSSKNAIEVPVQRQCSRLCPRCCWWIEYVATNFVYIYRQHLCSEDIEDCPRQNDTATHSRPWWSCTRGWFWRKKGDTCITGTLIGPSLHQYRWYYDDVNLSFQIMSNTHYNLYNTKFNPFSTKMYMLF